MCTFERVLLWRRCKVYISANYGSVVLGNLDFFVEFVMYTHTIVIDYIKDYYLIDYIKDYYLN